MIKLHWRVCSTSLHSARHVW